MLRTCLVLLTGCVLSLVSGCELGAEPRVDPPPVAVSDPASDRRALPRPQRLLDAGLDRLPRLRTRLPRSVPERADAFPSLLTDPPGRALLAYHPPEEWFDGPEGWASETLLFFGRDRRWRSLRMDELDLPAEAWTGGDTYGAGSLSPDGRWWAGKSRAGVVLLDLSTGQHRLVDTGTNWVSEIQWLSGSRAYVVSNGRVGPGGRTHRVTVPDLQVSELPYRLWQVGIAPDDTAFSLRRIRIGEAELVEHRRAELVPHGRLVLPGLGRDLQRLWSVAPIEGRFALHHQPDLLDFRRVELVVVDATSLEVEARLAFDNRDNIVRFYHWLDPETMLIETPDGIVAWRPHSARLLRVLDVPPAGANRYWSVELAGWVGAGVMTTSE
jgi:hypothetical protein